MNKLSYLTIVFFFNISVVFSQNITVDGGYTAQDLIQNVLFSNPCASASVSNVSVSGGNFGTTEKSWGYFNSNGSIFPFQDGIILSTGKITNAVGPNTTLSDDNANNWGGDLDLNQALNINNSTNATILEFDFVPSGTKVSFDYIFASEEYHGNAPCTYSDGFAFLLQEVGSSNYQNLALIPGTNIPVKVTTVHPAILGACLPENEEYFDSYNDASSPINYNGQTVILNAQADVNIGSTYHIKLVIADEGNFRYDSAIFLKGGSFDFEVSLGNDRTFADRNPICYDESLTLEVTDSSATTYKWLFNGAPIPGETNSTLNFTPPYNTLINGIYEVIINEGGLCERKGEINLDFSENVILNETSYTKCDDDGVRNGVTYFNPIDIINIKSNLFLNLPNYYTVELFKNPTDITPISIPFYNSTPYSDVIYAKITNSSCFSPIPINITVNTFIINTPNITTNICEEDNITLQAEAGYSYLWSTGETTSSITVNTQGIYTVDVIGTYDCSATQFFTVISSEKATITNININDLSLNNSAEIIVSGNGDYEFSLDGINYQDSNTFTNLEPGEYLVYVQDKNGCGVTTMQFYILDYPKYFTPNNDGHNDTWQIKNLEKRGLEASKIYIFDRYGKLLKQITPLGNGWDGLFNGVELPSTDYWFTLEQPNGKTIRGHFSLNR